MAGDFTYSLSLDHWPEEGAVTVFDVQNNHLCTIPLGSLEASNDLNWSYLLYCVGCCVEEMGDLYEKDTSSQVPLSAPVKEGNYVFLRQGG